MNDKQERKKRMQDQINEILDIDLTHLDEHCIQQARLFHKYAKEVVKAEDEVRSAKVILRTVEADLQLRIRKRPKRFKLPEKITEIVVTSAITVHFKFQEAQKEYHRALSNHADAMILKEAIQQKNFSLKELVQLHGQSYFADPKIETDVRNLVDSSRTERMRKSRKRKDEKKND